MIQTPNADIADYYSAETFKRIKDFADGKETPFVVIDTQTIDRQYEELVEGFPYAKVYYAVKANPSPDLVQILWDNGVTHYDVASIAEVRLVRATLPEATAEDFHGVTGLLLILSILGAYALMALMNLHHVPDEFPLMCLIIFHE